VNILIAPESLGTGGILPLHVRMPPGIDFWYDLLIFLLKIILKLFFKISVRGFRFVPSSGPVLFVGAPHANQFVDPCMLQITSKRRIGFLAAASSMRKRMIGFIARCLDSISVERPQDLAKVGQGRIYYDQHSKSLKGVGTIFKNQIQSGDIISIEGTNSLVVNSVVSDDELFVKTGPIGTDYPNNSHNAAFGFKITPRVDQSSMFQNVTRRLAENKCVGIFPEGGSHDRSELLPLKPGVAIMALNVLSEYPLVNLTIIPVGLNYFQAHKFRSRAVIEYGRPLVIDDNIIEMYGKGGAFKSEAILKFMSIVRDRLSEITLNAPTLEMLEVKDTELNLDDPNHSQIIYSFSSFYITRRISLNIKGHCYWIRKMQG
jgi:glycerol-3-phosphate O-acyltransferase/dihydroxyacetone phosphate acyltransferase